MRAEGAAVIRRPFFLPRRCSLRIPCLILATLGLSAPASAQAIAEPQEIDVTDISGMVPSTCSVEALVAARRLRLSGQAQDVTDVVYRCNNADGITRRISSLNNGRLLRGTQGIPYLISQEGATDLAFPPVSLAGPVVTELPPSIPLTNGTTGLLRLTIPAVPAGLLAGEYIDTITIEIVPN